MATLPLDAGPAARRLAHEAVERGAMQKTTELAQLLELLAGRSPRSVVEIGTARGGTLYALCQVAEPDAIVVSIDLPGGPFGGGYSEAEAEAFRSFVKPGQQLECLRADSQDPETRRRLERILEGRAIDVLLIDGDHTYFGVRRDFEVYSPLVAPDGLIVLHDVLPHTEMPECKVDLLWREVKDGYEHLEFLDPADERGWGQWGGIGVLFNSPAAGDGRAPTPDLAEEVRAALEKDVARARAEVRELERRAGELEQRAGELEQRGEELEARLRDAEAATAEAAARGDRLQARLGELEAGLAEERGRRAHLEALVRRRERERDVARTEAAAATAPADAHLLARIAQLETQLATIGASRGWKLLEAYRGAVTRARRPLAPLRRAATRTPAPPPPAAAGGPKAPPAPPPPAAPPERERRLVGAAGSDIVFAETADPAASIVIPAFNNVAYTLRCLASLAANTPHELIEVIVVDDVSTDSTPEALAQTTGVRVLRNETNLGFLQTCNRGAAAARGRYVLFLNNDTEVEPGWLEPLLEAAESAPDVGAVGSKLVYPDGTLQEAGAYIWSDGQAWNFGRGGDPRAPEYNYRREVDYCSGAALMVRRDLLERIGGFDVRYSPIYYEDTDLCFALRAEGHRVLYEPRSVVVHHEGTTHGTEEKAGVGGSPHSKTSQYRNRHVFARKWARELARQRPPGTSLGYRGGRVDRRPRVLVVDTWVPAHDQDSGSLRMTWILRLLRELGCAVTLFPTDNDPREPYTSELQRAGVEVVYGTPFAHLAQAREALYDVVIASRPYVAVPLLDEIGCWFPDATLVYDMIDVHFLREERRAELLGRDVALDFERIRQEELLCIRRSDITVPVSDAEAALVRELVPDTRTVVLPNVHEVDADGGKPFEERRDLLFIGGFRHDPNVDAAIYLAREILPRVRERVDARLWILGSHPPAEVTALQTEHVAVTGHLPDVSPHFRSARVFVAPLRYGAGMKGKIGHALASGLPVVTTTIGTEGMDLVDGRDVLVRDDPDGFAQAVVDVYSDAELWERLARAGVEVVRERWTPEAMRRRLEGLLRECKLVGAERFVAAS